jgi:hypothetical protein
MYNLYSVLKTLEHDLLLVRRLRPVSPALLPSGRTCRPSTSADRRAVSKSDCRLTIYMRRCNLERGG